MERTTKVYISGPIAYHDIIERRHAFLKAIRDLLERGYSRNDIFNPFDNGIYEKSPYSEHMKADIKILLECDAIYMLKGWEQSNGAKLEFNVATSCGLKVIYE